MSDEPAHRLDLLGQPMRNLINVQVEVVCASTGLPLNLILDVCLTFGGLLGITMRATPDGDHEVL